MNTPSTVRPDWTDPEVIVVRYGTRQTTKSECYYNFGAYREPDAAMTMDYFFWIFRSAEQTIVIDTGFSPEAAIARKRQPVVAPADALARLGIDPKDVKLLVLTHAHYDHAGNLGLYPNAKIVMSRKEFEFWGTDMGKRPQYGHHIDPLDIERIQALHREGRITLLDTPQNTLIPGIELYELGGHTPGQMAVVVEMPEGPVILASDAIHYYDELEQDRPFAVLDSLADMYRGYERIREWLQRPGAVVIPGHDPDVMNRFAPVDASDPSFAVRIDAHGAGV
ncbi:MULTISPECIES: N-acyl homoserine lactonase family protein [unclassified Pseudomonas]|jgi:glyoxylase-like metal-dependent hydrolase (beta-lactamase superfamily II)|uniref:N-acyl homoserine lactonase family protein n=1 Tax=unclassified Pseudomonas TaxID=196821 RepID=UPI0017858D74|nr:MULTISPECIES: N-acyl homoserine lactonase family protein [unclassified Pseudomonas]MBD8706458.1 N-acyl homoserine lactonase family protein [Pseudomonas sp. CFBP 13711]MBD8712628.1 N-acyl homoserine lactonase family protein [Pseudomonas sp. CFBP 13715]